MAIRKKDAWRDRLDADELAEFDENKARQNRNAAAAAKASAICRKLRKRAWARMTTNGKSGN